MGISSIIAYIPAGIAVVSAIIAWSHAKIAKEQAGAAKEATSLIKAERKRKIVEKCLEIRPRSDWRQYVESLSLSKKEKEHIIENVNIALGKKKKG